MRLIVACSRSVPIGVSMLVVDAAVRVHRLRPGQVIVGPNHDPDCAGKLWARQRGVLVREFRVNWIDDGDHAMQERNERMARAGTHLLAIFDGGSESTGDMIYRARAHQMPTMVLDIVPSAATSARMAAERKERRRTATARTRTHPRR